MTLPSVTAIIVNWNGAAVIEPCLRTVASSSYANLSILVVDNASDDGSVAIITERFPDVVVSRTGANLGYAGGANVGLRAACERGADYILLMNNDIEIAPDAVEELVRAAEAHPEAAFLGPKIYYHEARDMVWSAGGVVSLWTGDIHHIGIRERDTGQYEELREVDYLTGCAILLPARALDTVGYLDESYYMYNEDTDWCTRAIRGGCGVLYVPTARLWHKVSTSSGGGLTRYKIYHRIRSTLAYFRRYAAWYHWIGILPATAIRTLGFVIRQLILGEGGRVSALLRGLVDGATGRGRAYTND